MRTYSERDPGSKGTAQWLCCSQTELLPGAPAGCARCPGYRTHDPPTQEVVPTQLMCMYESRSYSTTSTRQLLCTIAHSTQCSCHSNRSMGLRVLPRLNTHGDVTPDCMSHRCALRACDHTRPTHLGKKMKFEHVWLSLRGSYPASTLSGKRMRPRRCACMRTGPTPLLVLGC